MLQQPTQSKEFISTISSKGQVTLPVLVRRYLGVETNDKVAFIIEPAEGVKLTQARFPDIHSLKGAAGILKQPMKWKEVKKVAYEDRLENKYGK